MPFLVRRLGFYVVAAWAAVTVNFFIPRAMPGNAVDTMMAKFPNLQAQAKRALEAEFGVGHQGSLLHQYWVYLGNLAHLNLGTSVSLYPDKVTSVLASTVPWTLALVGTATIISFALGTLLGILAAWRRGGWLDQSLPAFTFLQATPYFFLALVVIQFFAVDLHAFPISGGYSLGLQPGWNWSFIGSAIDHALLPALTIVATSMAGWMLQMRNVTITTIGEDYVLAAQAKGLSSRRVIFTYAAQERDPAEHRRLFAGDRICRRRGVGDGDRILLPGRGLHALQRGAGQRLSAHAGDLPGDLIRGVVRLHDR